METLKDRILQFNPDTLHAVRKLYNLEKPGDISKAIDVLEEWIKTQKHFIKKDYSRDYLERGLIVSKGSLERTKDRLDKLCTLRTLMPQFFGNINLKTDFQIYENIIKQAALPRMTEDNHRVYILRNFGEKFESSLCLDYLKMVFHFAEYVRNHDYIAGIIIVVDYLKVNMADLIMKLNIVDLRHGLSMLTDGYGMRVKGIHILSQSKMIDVVVTIFKQIFSEKIGGRIHVHKSAEGLHDYLPKDILPVEYGGKERSLVELNDEWTDILSAKEFREFYKEMSEAKTDEACRQKDKFNEQYMGMPGSFRTLSVD